MQVGTGSCTSLPVPLHTPHHRWWVGSGRRNWNPAVMQDQVQAVQRSLRLPCSVQLSITSRSGTDPRRSIEASATLPGIRKCYFAITNPLLHDSMAAALNLLWIQHRPSSLPVPVQAKFALSSTLKHKHNH